MKMVVFDTMYGPRIERVGGETVPIHNIIGYIEVETPKRSVRKEVFARRGTNSSGEWTAYASVPHDAKNIKVTYEVEE